jgi:hypothetical protein
LGLGFGFSALTFSHLTLLIFRSQAAGSVFLVIFLAAALRQRGEEVVGHVNSLRYLSLTQYRWKLFPVEKSNHSGGEYGWSRWEKMERLGLYLRVEITLVPLLHDQAARLTLPRSVQAAQVEASGIGRDGRVVSGRGLAGEVLGFVERACAVVAKVLYSYVSHVAWCWSIEWARTGAEPDAEPDPEPEPESPYVGVDGVSTGLEPYEPEAG